ncbi:MAG: 1-(5-phosphoribosyl)-5-[(5-phosphoribosylamino)methylideneamino]imidazole-4-carboxamide isomerase [Sediminibacterium sp.]|jgi:phosphoribosylformimino-5-aminoimidazole carboxamide ribotide isomerase|nr:1-(5-phosphoribosyl)-5-[(5-phosphoribosylamino)methylideneamino]imidazole-4-carboxamide isomerase [Hydrotalea sp.]MCU0338067.1 1-(5-phosphoribosyl)-5-[(5-phosphoribosylamino)methylideneamino]imidazole-4-carboxamide isomerase [Sediminibacterium sp.]
MIEIIPAIDLIDGACVRLTEGNYADKTLYFKDPLDAAKIFEDAGLKRLHLVDLDGAKAGQVKNWKVLERIASKTNLQIDFGGGILSEESLQIVVNSGATWITIGSLAVKNSELFLSWVKQYGPSKFMLGADVREEKITVSGWLENTDISVYSFIDDYLKQGIEQIFCTDVKKDGKLAGPSIELYQSILSKQPSLFLIASGGVSSVQDLHQLNEIGCAGVIVGKAIYEGKISTKELASFHN